MTWWYVVANGGSDSSDDRSGLGGTGALLIPRQV